VVEIIAAGSEVLNVTEPGVPTVKVAEVAAEVKPSEVKV
jgi:hypothetical protein